MIGKRAKNTTNDQYAHYNKSLKKNKNKNKNIKVLIIPRF
jgi:hypothetical protein